MKAQPLNTHPLPNRREKRSDVVWIISDIIFPASYVVFPMSHVVFGGRSMVSRNQMFLAPQKGHVPLWRNLCPHLPHTYLYVRFLRYLTKAKAA